MKPEDILILKHAFAVAGKVGAKAVLLHTDPIGDLYCNEKIPKKIKLILLSKKKKIEEPEGKEKSLASIATGVVAIP
nr:hypothetical protein [bacterium]